MKRAGFVCFVLLPWALLIGCSPEGEGPGNASKKGGAPKPLGQLHADENAPSADPAASVSRQSRIGLPSWFPNDVPLYEDCVIVASSRGPKGQALKLTYRVSASNEDVLDFYRKAVENVGWTHEETDDDQTQKAGLRCRKSGRTLAIEVETANTRTVCTLSLTR